jgi:hypothetical protein
MLWSSGEQIDRMDEKAAEEFLSHSGYALCSPFIEFLVRYSGLTIPLPFQAQPLKLFTKRIFHEWADSTTLPSFEDCEKWLLIADLPDSPVAYFLDAQGQVLMHYVSGWPHTAVLAGRLRSFLEGLSLLWDANRKQWWVDAYQAPSAEVAKNAAESFGLTRIDEASDQYMQWWGNSSVLVGTISHFDRRHWAYMSVAPGLTETAHRLRATVENSVEPHIVESRRWLLSNGLTGSSSEAVQLPPHTWPPPETLPAHSFRVASRDGLRIHDTRLAHLSIDEEFGSRLLALWPQYLEQNWSNCIYYCSIGLLACGHIDVCFDQTLSSVPVSGSVGWGGSLWPICFLHLMFPNAILIEDFTLKDISKWKTWFESHRGYFRWDDKLGTYAISDGD